MQTAIEQFLLWWTLFWASVGAAGGLADLPRGGIQGKGWEPSREAPFVMYYGGPPRGGWLYESTY